jgi:t-SNARE complex subunit (syntaxin)
MTTAKRPLDIIDQKGVVGFKMRFTPPSPYPLHIDGWPVWNRLAERLFRGYYNRSFKKMMFDTLKKHNVTVLMAVRQDVMRLGLSKYHGKGTGAPGHLQFKLARGVITKNEIGKIQVDCDRLEEIISRCEALHEENRLLMEEFKKAGIQSYPIFYEDFVTDKRDYLERLFKILELDITNDEISQVLGQEEYIKKVHSDDISEFVENHEEVTNRFADRYVSWQ